MGRIRGELLLPVEGFLEAGDHPVQGGGQPAHFVIALDVDPLAQIALADSPGDVRDPVDRFQSLVRQKHAAETGQEEDGQGRVDDDPPKDAQHALDVLRKTANDNDDARSRIDIERRRIQPHILSLGRRGGQKRALAQKSLLDDPLDVGKSDVGPKALQHRAVGVIDEHEVVE